MNQAGMGIGLGFGMAGMMQQTVAQGMGQQSTASPQPPASAIPASPIAVAAGTAASTEEAPFGRCGNCSAPLKEGAKFCMKCGTKVPPKAPEFIFCPECGTKLDGTAAFCTECGAMIQP
jgi:hypothetical protein